MAVVLQLFNKNYPLEILQKRFASGEITKEEYLEQREMLGEGVNQINKQQRS